MSSILDKEIVVKLNKNWVGFETMTVGKAITFLCSEEKGAKPGFAIDYETVVDEDGKHVITYTEAVLWEQWIKLPVREKDLVINVSGGRQIRVPLVVICAKYDKIPQIKERLTREAILKRDNYTCQYSGVKLPRSQLNIDHVIPKDRGGAKNTWENQVAAAVSINSRKGNKLNIEAGLQLIRMPKAPKTRAKVLKADDAKHPSQVPFLL